MWPSEQRASQRPVTMEEEIAQELKKWNSSKKSKNDAGSHRTGTQNHWRQSTSVRPSCEDSRSYVTPCKHLFKTMDDTHKSATKSITVKWSTVLGNWRLWKERDPDARPALPPKTFTNSDSDGKDRFCGPALRESQVTNPPIFNVMSGSASWLASQRETTAPCWRES